MTMRDLIGAAVGASFSFGLGWAATAGDPAAFMKWGLIASLGALGLLLLIDLTRRPWMSAHVTPLSQSESGTVLSLGFKNHGSRPFGPVIVNALVPDVFEITSWTAEGGPGSTGDMLHTPESIDGRHGSNYWNRSREFVPGSSLLYVHVTEQGTRLPIRIRIGEPRRTVCVDLRKLDSSHDIRDFGGVAPPVVRVIKRLPILGKKIGPDA